MTGLLAAFTGLAAGSAHVVTGPDHLAAVLPLAVGARKRAATIGALWGLGHGVAVIVLATLGRWLLGPMQIHTLSGASETLVGVLLVGLGIWTLHRSRLLVVHSHRHDHAHDEGDHQHVHVHVADRTVGRPEHPARGEHRAHHHGAFGFGLIHGAAGAGHLFGVLPSLAMGPTDAAVYLAAYFIGAVLAMTAFAAGVGRLTGNPKRLPQLLSAAGVASVLVGVFWLGGSLV